MQGLLTLEPRVTSRERCARKELYVVALVVKNLPANAGDMRREFDPWVGKFPWRRKWQPTPVFLPGESHGQRSLEGYSAWGHAESDTTKAI